MDLTATPLRILIIALVAVGLTVALRFVVSRVIRRLAHLPTTRLAASENAKIVLGDAKRMGQRLRTFQTVLNSTIAIILGTIAVLMILSELGVAVGPLLASAGVVGVALAFGAQSLVRDIISGVFMLVEDQYGVGDRVDLGATNVVMATGTIERVALRITTVRDDDGKIWHIRNGEIMRVANESQGWAQAIAQVQVVPETDVMAARSAMTEVTAELREDEGYRDTVLSDAEIRVEEITGSAITIRWSVRTAPGQQWRVASAMRRRIGVVFHEREIQLAD